MAVVIEILARNGKVLEHHVVDKDVVSIGRGYHNDVRLTDPYICEQHLRIEDTSGVLHFEDNSSVNGTLKNGRVTLRGELGWSDKLIIGRTHLRIFHSREKPVSPTLRFHPLEAKLAWFNQMPLAIGLTLVVAALAILREYLDSIEKFSLADALPSVFMLMLLACLWPLLFGLLSKLNKKEARLTPLFSIFWIAVLLMVVIQFGLKVINFNLGPGSWQPWFETLLETLVLFSLLWLSMFISLQQSRTRRNSISAGLVLSGLGIMLLSQYGGDRSDYSKLEYSPLLLPPVLQLSSPVNTDTFMQDAATIFEQANAQREQRER